jgi:UDP:flavonoid glycosyltransferase YjiC (YdhE family)
LAPFRVDQEVGDVLPVGDAGTPGEIAAAVDRLLGDPSYAATARQLAHAIANARGLLAAVCRLEQRGNRS